MVKTLPSNENGSQQDTGLARVLKNASKELKKNEKKKLHTISPDKEKPILEYNFDFGAKKFAFSKNSLYILTDKNRFRIKLVKIVAHPYIRH